MAEAVDVAIVGGGLAGTTLAWHLGDAGQRFVLFDMRSEASASRVAAGLVPLVTGPRLAPNWRINEFWPYAKAFYRRVEAVTGVDFLHERLGWRVLADVAEAQWFAKRKDDPAIRAYLAGVEGALDPSAFSTEGGAFQYRTGQLDVGRFLDASVRSLNTVTRQIDWSRDVSVTGANVEIAGWRARRVVSCEGYRAARNPWFAAVPFSSARGDVLTIRCERPLADEVVHGRVWLAPTEDRHVFLAGSTFDHDVLEERPREEGRADIEARLRVLLRVPFEVIGHRAGVRPIIRKSRPVIGVLPETPWLSMFNGLGAKGVLTAPWFARGLTRHLVEGVPLEAAMDVRGVLR